MSEYFSGRPDRRSRHLPIFTAIAVAVLLSCAVQVAWAAKIKGKITNFYFLQNPVWAEAKSPKKHGYSFRELVPTVPAQYRKLFPHVPKEICIAALGSANQKPSPPVLVRVGGGRTTPVTIVVPPGTKLTFKNTDPFKHRLYAVGVKEFSPNDTTTGGTREWSVPKAGVFEIRDELAPSLRMWIVGEPRVAAIAYPSMDGEFMLDVETPGEYQVQAYFAGKKVGAPVALEFEGKNLDISKNPIKVAEEKKSKKEEKE